MPDKQSTKPKPYFLSFSLRNSRGVEKPINHLQNTMLRQINRLNISPKNFAGKAIINGRTSSIHSSDKMKHSGILMFNSDAFRYGPKRRAVHRSDCRRCTHQFYNGLFLEKKCALTGKLLLAEGF